MGNDHLKGESIGQRIWHLRNKFGISQKDLAKVVGTSVDMIKKYEKDIITEIPYAEIEIIASALHTPPAYLLYGKAGLFPGNTAVEYMADEENLLEEFIEADIDELELMLELNDKPQEELDTMVASGMFNKHIEGYMTIALRSIGYPESEINSIRNKLRNEILGQIPAESARKTGEIIGLPVKRNSAAATEKTDHSVIVFPFKKPPSV